jgi:hypothetical protein
MKTKIFASIILMGILCSSSIAQNPDNTVNKAEINKLKQWVGKWKGEGSMQMGPGEPKKSTVNETIELKLDGTILVVEGVGKAIDPATKQEMVVHHAFGIVSYDAMSKNYKFKTYLKDGRSSDAWFNMVGENKYEWGFDIPGGVGKTKYSITLDPVKNTWNEIGEFSRDGNTWMKFFEMNLVKI